VKVPRAICILLGRHELAGVMIRLANGSTRILTQCPTCGAAY
jgi:hypothetical protein